MVSLHHVVPLGRSLRRLSEVLRHGARLVVDEFDVEALDERAARLVARPARQRQGRRPTTSPRCASTCTRSGRSARSSRAWFDVGEPVPGAYLYRWPLDPELRDEEERLIAAGELPAVGRRFIAIRRC